MIRSSTRWTQDAEAKFQSQRFYSQRGVDLPLTLGSSVTRLFFAQVSPDPLKKANFEVSFFMQKSARPAKSFNMDLK